MCNWILIFGLLNFYINFMASYITEISQFNQAPLSSEKWIATFSRDSTDTISASFGSYPNQTVQSFWNWVTISKECPRWRKPRQREWNECQQICAATKVIICGGPKFHRYSKRQRIWHEVFMSWCYRNQSKSVVNVVFFIIFGFFMQHHVSWVWVCAAIVVKISIDWTCFIIKAYCVSPVTSSYLKEQSYFWECNSWSAFHKSTICQLTVEYDTDHNRNITRAWMT
jgi:hypothetical protein